MNVLEGFSLAGDHFIASISMPERDELGIIRWNRDPRKAKKKPDTYSGVVLEVSPSCQYVKVGDQVVFERWEWGQVNLDDDRILVAERDLIIINDVPYTGYLIFKLEDLSPRKENGVLLPQTHENSDKPALCGEVLASGVSDISPGEHYIFQRHDRNQYYYGDGRMAFRINRGADILAKYDFNKETADVG
jgi:hypothetical protein